MEALLLNGFPPPVGINRTARSAGQHLSHCMLMDSSTVIC